MLIKILVMVLLFMNSKKEQFQLDRYETPEAYEVYFASDLRYMGACNQADLLLGLPDEMEDYKSYRFQFTMNIPYNEIWGTRKYRLTSFEPIQTQKHLFIHQFEFGPLLQVSNNSCQRTHELYVRETQPATTILSLLSEENQAKIITLDQGKSAVEYIIPGKLNHHVIEVIGPKYNIGLIERPFTLPGFTGLTTIADSVAFFEYQ